RAAPPPPAHRWPRPVPWPCPRAPPSCRTAGPGDGRPARGCRSPSKLPLLEHTLGPDEFDDALGHLFGAAGEHLGVAGLLRLEQAPHGDAGPGPGGRRRHFLDPARLLGLTDPGDRGVAGWLAGGLHADDGRKLHFEAGGFAPAELLADDDRVVLALDADDDAD